MESFISCRIVFGLTVLVMNVLCNPLTSDSIAKTIYSELEAFNISCLPLDLCKSEGKYFPLYDFVCECDSSCSMHGTCCLDSEFRTQQISPKKKSKCLSVYSTYNKIFMVDSCKDEQTFDDLCYSNPEESNDPFLIIPVKSDVTGITYKNYFCAVCNEDVDSEQLKFWDMEIWVNGIQLQSISEPQFKFNKAINKWTINGGESIEISTAVPVTLKIKQTWETKVKYCVGDLIETCSGNWIDEDTAAKCREYTATVYSSPNFTYKNPHCAFCNFENLSNLKCLLNIVVSTHIASNPFLRLFVLEDRKKRCGKNMVYDKFADKCRCNSKIYRKENGKCVHKI